MQYHIFVIIVNELLWIRVLSDTAVKLSDKLKSTDHM